jgi:surface carbohydrate biosynthesis protein
MRKIKLIKSCEIDVLIVDEMGSNLINYCIPSFAKRSILPIRNAIPIIMSFKFLFHLSKRLIGFRNPKIAFINAIIDALNPKILITFIDNSSLMGLIKCEFEDKRCISVQNGRRTGFKYPTASFSREIFDIYYGFGDCERQILFDEGINVNEYFSVGSLRYGIYKKYFHKNVLKKYQICFISEYIGIPKDESLIELISNSSRLFKHLIEVCSIFDYKICVAMRSDKLSSSLKNEINYFKNLDKNNVATLIPNYSSKLKSYQTVLTSEIAVSSLSTLGYEAMGFGNKVLFGAGDKNFKLAKMQDSYRHFEKLESFNIIGELTFESVSKKINNLLNMDNNEYYKKTQKSREQYMNINVDKYPHNIIKDKIRSFLTVSQS